MSRDGVRTYRVMRIASLLATIQAVQLVNLVPLLIDPRPEFMLGLAMNFATGLLAIPVAYAVWTRRREYLLFAIFALAGAAHFGYLVAVHFGTPFFLQPLSMSSVMMTVNLAFIILLLFIRLVEKPDTTKN